MPEPLVKCSRVWAMPHKYTFQVKPLREIVERHIDGSRLWLDPFAGYHSPVKRKFQNDLNPASPAKFHLEAAEFLQRDDIVAYAPFDGAIFDPPYSLTQVSRSYIGMGLKFKGKENPTGGFPVVRDLLANTIRPGGVCISFGWNTVGLGKGRGFEPVEYMICSHGGNRNDTLVAVERKVRGE